MDERFITLVQLTPKQIYDVQLILKRGKMVKNKSLYIKEILFAIKVLWGFDDDDIILYGTYFVSS